jgi:hypothetical protein
VDTVVRIPSNRSKVAPSRVEPAAGSVMTAAVGSGRPEPTAVIAAVGLLASTCVLPLNSATTPWARTRSPALRDVGHAPPQKP